MCQMLFSDESTFFEDTFTERGDKKVKKTVWKQLPQLGRVREMEFLSQIEVQYSNVLTNIPLSDIAHTTVLVKPFVN